MDSKLATIAAGDILKRVEYNPKKLAAIHTGVTLLVTLLLTAADFYLTRTIDASGGLSQSGNRAILGTVQSILSMIVPLLLPFWEVGFLAATLRNVRYNDAIPGDLLSGFRRAGAVARLYLLQLAFLIAIALVSVQVASTLYSFTPNWQESMTTVEEIITQAQASGQMVLSDEDIARILPALMPIYAIAMVLMTLIVIPVFYLLRMSFFALFDDAKGAFSAVKTSFRIMFRHGIQLFLLDLRFWWYYLAQLVIAAVAYLDLILPALGVQLPLSEDVLFFGSYGIYLILQFILAWQFASYVQTSYGVCYDHWKAELVKKDTQPQVQVIDPNDVY